MFAAVLTSKQNSQLKTYSQDMFSFVWPNFVDSMGTICANIDIINREPSFRRLRGNGL